MIKDTIEKLETLFDSLSTIQQLSTNYTAFPYLKDRCSYLLKSLHDLSKFKEGDRVKLSKEPEISSTKNYGWLGSKHFLVKGALGTIKEVSHFNGVFRYSIEFDEETICVGNSRVIPKRKASFCFEEEYLISSNEIKNEGFPRKVLISCSNRWSSWCDYEDAQFVAEYKPIIEFIDAGGKVNSNEFYDLFKKLCSFVKTKPYEGCDLKVVEINSPYKIMYHDNGEYIIERDNDEWFL